MPRTIHLVNREDKTKGVDWEDFRRFCKAQRERLAYRFGMAERRIALARGEGEWERPEPAGKKPRLDEIEARWR